MHRPLGVALFCLGLGCTTSRPTPSALVPVPAVPGAETVEASHEGVTWTIVRAEIEDLVCLRAEREVGRIAAVYGDREACGLAPAETAVQRAVDRAFEEARPVLLTLQDERRAALDALELEQVDARLRGVRRAYVTERFVTALLPRVLTALESEGVRCRDCPRPAAPERRELDWASFEPYLFAYVWPDPVVTPRDEHGRAVGRPKIRAHICGGINGVAELDEPDSVLLRAAHLAALQTAMLHEQVPRALTTLVQSSVFEALSTDEQRTEFLRRKLGPTIMADPDVRLAVCETLARFQADVGVAITDC